MLYETDSKVGRITFDKGVLSSIIIQEVEAADGKIILCNSKGKPVKNTAKKSGADGKYALSVSGSDEGGFFDFSWEAGKLNIIVYIVVKLGGSINAPAEALNYQLNGKIRELLGISPSSITVIIKGIQSVNISGRDICIKRSYDVTLL
jgi:uncharacterized alkaline shock family protein YloU